jgi:carboxylesterase
LGYKNISLAGSSTGGALIIELLAREKFSSNPPKNIFMIDAIVVPGSKLLSMIDILGPVLGNSISGTTAEEAAHWYTNRPQEALNELMDVITLVRHDLEDIIQLPAKTDLVIYKTKRDQTADPISGLLMYKGTKATSGGTRALKMLDSKRHVFTRGAGRDNWTEVDKTLQYRAFNEIRLKLLGQVIADPL